MAQNGVLSLRTVVFYPQDAVTPLKIRKKKKKDLTISGKNKKSHIIVELLART